MNYWWVNQNQTYAHEVAGGYLWSPKTNADGRRNQFYDNMTRTAPGDVVFSFCDTETQSSRHRPSSAGRGGHPGE